MLFSIAVQKVKELDPTAYFILFDNLELVTEIAPRVLHANTHKDTDEDMEVDHVVENHKEEEIEASEVIRVVVRPDIANICHFDLGSPKVQSIKGHKRTPKVIPIKE